MSDDARVFEAHRPQLVGLGYRMLGDRARAEELVQEAWLRFSAHADAVEDPRAWLVTVVSRLCLSELRSARARREEGRAVLPEPVDTEAEPALADVSMALLVALQRLTPTERVVLLLHDVLDLDHAQIGALVGRTDAASRKVLQRARAHVAAGTRALDASPAEHEGLLAAFVTAASTGDVAALVGLLAPDATLVTDGGPTGAAIAGFRSLPGPLTGAELVARFVCAVTVQAAPALEVEARVLNGRRALVLRRDGRPFAALLLAVGDGRVHRVYFQADPARLAGLA